MKPERYIVTAVPIGGGERVTGQRLNVDGLVFIVNSAYFASAESDRNHRIICINEKDRVMVDPATIEPVRELVKRERTLVGDFRCPNCNAAYIEGMGATPYCGNCGQALDWSLSEEPCYDAEFWGAENCCNTECPYYSKDACPAAGGCAGLRQGNE